MFLLDTAAPLEYMCSMTLHAYRIKSGLSQFEMAVRAGVTPGTIVNIERGRGCTAGTAKRIIDATAGEVTLEDLVPLSDQDPKSEDEGQKTAGA